MNLQNTSMSTLLSELDTAPAQGDGDFVQNILNEMNGGAGPTNPPIQPPPAVGGMNQGVIQAPNPNTIAPRQMDAGPATAHMIGNSQPTPADFAQMMNTTGPVAASQGDQWGSNYQAQQPRPVAPAPKRSWLARSMDEIRVASFVSILVFLFSLPVVNFLFAHYLPWSVKSTGELTMVGLLLKSIGAGISFWILQRVIVPLLSL
ncbi:MAG: hypothetical protein EBU66_06935 [Bacteroidetes bacterium]|jgi:hypothetical protein|nr:hypothetical protein [bacterium]NBP64396.1 hypothetical protein [Bacteroidota bacterium]